MALSQSFDLGNSTFFNLENAIGKANKIGDEGILHGSSQRVNVIREEVKNLSTYFNDSFGENCKNENRNTHLREGHLASNGEIKTVTKERKTLHDDSTNSESLNGSISLFSIHRGDFLSSTRVNTEENGKNVLKVSFEIRKSSKKTELDRNEEKHKENFLNNKISESVDSVANDKSSLEVIEESPTNLCQKSLSRIKRLRSNNSKKSLPPERKTNTFRKSKSENDFKEENVSDFFKSDIFEEDKLMAGTENEKKWNKNDPEDEAIQGSPTDVSHKETSRRVRSRENTGLENRAEKIRKDKFRRAKSDTDFKNENLFSESLNSELNGFGKEWISPQVEKGCEINPVENKLLNDGTLLLMNIQTDIDENKNTHPENEIKEISSFLNEITSLKETDLNEKNPADPILEGSVLFEDDIYLENCTAINKNDESKCDSMVNIEDTSFIPIEDISELKSLISSENTSGDGFEDFHVSSASCPQNLEEGKMNDCTSTQDPKLIWSANSTEIDENVSAHSEAVTTTTGGNKLINNVKTKEINVPNENNSMDQNQSGMKAEKLKSLSNWNLPGSIIKEYKKKGITEMFDWQIECLFNPRVLFESKNLVYSAPTSAGKTLVSEILLMKTILERKRKVMIILPFISVVREKMFYFQDLLSSSGYRAEGFFGGYSPGGGFEAVNVAICTIEKANSIVNKLLDQGKLGELGLIIVDEVHLISDPGRGYILELLMAKILYMNRKSNFNIQLVTMSATLTNAELLASWLEGVFYNTNFRPVQLNEMLKVGLKIFNDKMNLVREIDTNLYSIDNDQDHVAYLSIETILDGHSIIVFCPSKDWCESLCIHLASSICKLGKSNETYAEKLRQYLQRNSLDEVKNKLKEISTGLDVILEKTITYGCAFHHAGLTAEERDIIENSFKCGFLKIIVATSTLSSGVNLPARRVIIRTPMFGGKQMSSLTYKQMIGRAGRTGKDTLGESILICQENNLKMGKDLIHAKLQPLVSCLNSNDHVHFKRALLEIISSGVAKTRNDLNAFVDCTLYKRQSFTDENDQAISETNSIEEVIKNTLDFLIDHEFIRMQSNDGNEEFYMATQLGLACLAASLPPHDGLILFSELQRSRKCFVLDSELHAVYLVTPYSVCYQLSDLDWFLYLDIWEKLSPAMKKVGELIGIKESFLVRAMRGQSKLDYNQLQIHKRFFIALALQELVEEVPINKVAGKYKCSRGLLQSLQQMSSLFAGIVTAFCNSLNWTTLALILSQFKERLFFGIHKDLIDLMKIPEMNSQRARSLFNAGVENLVKLANAETITIEKILYTCTVFDSVKKQDNENEWEANERNKMRNFYITGKLNLSVSDAARFYISEARKYLQYEIGVTNIKWSQERNAHTENSNEDEAVNGLIDSCREITLDSKKKRATCSGDTECSPPKIIKTDVNNHGNTDGSSDIVSSSKIGVDCPRNLRRSSRIKLNHKNSEPFKKGHQKSRRTCKDGEESQILLEDRTNNESVINSFSLNDNEDCTQSKYSTFAGLNSLNSSHILSMSKTNQKSIMFDCIHLIEVCSNRELFNLAIKTINESTYVGFSVALEKLPDKRKPLIGANLLVNQKETKIENTFNFICDELFYMRGISICVEDNVILFFNMQDSQNADSIDIEERIDAIKSILCNKSLVLRIFDAKEQLKILAKAFKELPEIHAIVEDPKIANWLLQPDKMLSLNEMTAQYIPECKGLCGLAGRYQIYSSVGLNYNSSIVGKLRSGIEACISLHMLIEQLENLERVDNGALRTFYQNIEMPVQVSLYRMESIGFSVDQEILENINETVNDSMTKIEKKIYELHGSRFNLRSSSAVGRVLGLHKKANGKISTSKQILEKIDSPLAMLILNYRKINAVLTKNVQPLLRCIKNNKIFGNSITFTSTGRISMHEPNLQNVAKTFIVNISGLEKLTVSPRDAFRPSSKERCLLSADFCQLEMRILTHLCKDPALIKTMKSKNDIFKEMAVKWNNNINDENEVTDALRNGTKQICYGIIYGMGMKSLSESLRCTEEEAIILSQQFHAAFPRIRSYIEDVIKFAKQNEYIETITGRRRYLDHINSSENSPRSHAERQAVNSTIQGSAADIAKKAIIKIEKNFLKYREQLRKNSSFDVSFVLHVHDELLFELPKNNLVKVAKMIKSAMETSVKLDVPLRVKMKYGDSWGNMKDYHF